MPELPEVETVVRTLRPRLVGKSIAAVRLNRRDIVTPAEFDLAAHLRDRRIESIDRRAKRIVFTLHDRNRFYVHLGMSGRMGVHAPADATAPHTHLVIDVGGLEARFVDPRRFGGVFWIGLSGDDEDLGPEPLDLSTKILAARLAATSRAVKAALLDQKLIAGLGNIYVDESLFVAGIHPSTRADRIPLDRVGSLNRAIKATLRRAIKHRGSTLRDYRDADGSPGGFQTLFRVYDREGQACVNCETPIRRIVQGGRSTHFCPKCQTRK